MPTEYSNQKNRLINYLLWLEDRGFRQDRPVDWENIYNQKHIQTKPDTSADIQQVPSSAENISDSANIRLIVLAEGLDSEDREMLANILKALSIESNQFRLTFTANDSQVEHFKEACVLILGWESVGHRNSTWANVKIKQNELIDLETTGQYILLISHPRAMRNNPELKRDAWNGLQKLKAVLSSRNALPNKT